MNSVPMHAHVPEYDYELVYLPAAPTHARTRHSPTHAQHRHALIFRQRVFVMKKSNRQGTPPHWVHVRLINIYIYISTHAKFYEVHRNSVL